MFHKLKSIMVVLLAIAVIQSLVGIPTASAQALSEVSPPDVTAKAVYVVDATLGQPLYEKESDARRSPASLTKLATALVVMQQADDLSELVTIDPADVLTPEDGQSMVGLVAGDVLTVRNMLYGLLLNSGNDAANALARHFGQKMLNKEDASGEPIARFVQAMNQFASDHGLTNSHFVNTEGLYDPDHYSSARDLATLATLVLADPTLAETVSTPAITITSSAAIPIDYALVNTNELLGDDGIIGVKTGTLSESGACLVSAKISPAGTVVVSVVLGSDIQFDEQDYAIPDSDKRYQDASTIFNAMTSDYTWLLPQQKGAMPGLPEELAVWNVGMNNDLPILIPSSEANDLQYRLRLGPPESPGSIVGSLMLYNGDQLVAEKPVVQLPLTL